MLGWVGKRQTVCLCVVRSSSVLWAYIPEYLFVRTGLSGCLYTRVQEFRRVCNDNMCVCLGSEYYVDVNGGCFHLSVCLCVRTSACVSFCRTVSGVSVSELRCIRVST